MSNYEGAHLLHHLSLSLLLFYHLSIYLLSIIYLSTYLSIYHLSKFFQVPGLILSISSLPSAV